MSKKVLTFEGLLALKKFSKAELSRQFSISYMQAWKWCNDPERFIKLDRSYKIDLLLNLPKGTTMDIVMGRVTENQFKKIQLWEQ